MEKFVNFSDGIIYNDELWFSNFKFNALQKLNLKNGEVSIVSFFPEFKAEEYYLHSQLIEHNKKIYFIPLDKSVINIWNLESNNWEKSIKLPYDVKLRYSKAFLKGSFIWLFPYCLKDVILKIDLTNNKVSELRNLTDKIKAKFSEDVYLWPSNISLYKEKFYITAFDKDVLLVVDSDSEEIVAEYKLENEPIRGIQPIEDDKCVFFTDKSPELFIWDLKADTTKSYKVDFNLKNGQVSFSDFLYEGKKIIALPKHIDEIFAMDLTKDEVIKLELPVGFQRSSPYPLFEFAKSCDNKVYLFPRGCNKLLCINLDDLSVTEIKQHFSKEFTEYYDDIVEKTFKCRYKTGELLEADYWSETLPKFLDLVCLGEQTDLKIEESNVGLNIHKVIKKLLS